MKLHISQTSPYARKCRVLILEMGLENRIDIVDNPPLDDPANLLEINPLGKCFYTKPNLVKSIIIYGSPCIVKSIKS